MNGGARWRALLDEMARAAQAEGDLATAADTLGRAVATLRDTAEALFAMDPAEAAGGATPFLRMFGLTVTAQHPVDVLSVQVLLPAAVGVGT